MEVSTHVVSTSTEHAQKCEHMLLAHCVNMAALVSSSPASEKHRQNAIHLSGRLQCCWSVDINWELYPPIIKEVRNSAQF